ncbi:MAG: GNAT family N-acetyltransferase [Limosilactobacillus sp.]|uniref:GNAT family N-acetyltransferase n=1 Tax=Limosilactobacillus sp. TaxID=2773925 RepID=UPI002702026E|nr:GNAT family N-acetyltransferase [Limosilactobacillus sp.]
MVKINHATLADLDAIMAIERAGFSEEEAGTPEAFRQRIELLPDTFLVARDGDRVVGFIVGPASREKYVNDDMYEHTSRNFPIGGHQLILSIAVAPDYRGQGLGSELLAGIEEVARLAFRETISLTSLEKNVPFYEKNGFTKAGVSTSDHAGEVWYNMVKVLTVKHI